MGLCLIGRSILPATPNQVELRTLQRQLAQISRQLAAMADDMDGGRES